MVQQPSRTMLYALRGRRGLEESDASQDSRILAMAPEQMVRECAAWELGDQHWASRIAGWIVQVGADPKKV